MTAEKRSDESKLPEEQFPIKLHRILNDAETQGFSEIITWMPEGTSFKILDKNKLETVVMPQYFTSCRFKTFQRSLNLWGFVADNKKSDAITGGGRRHHPMFVKGKPELCASMSRIRVKQPGSRGSRKTNDPTSPPQRPSDHTAELPTGPIPASCNVSVLGASTPSQHGLGSSLVPPMLRGNPNLFQLSQNIESDRLLNTLLTHSLSNPLRQFSPAILDVTARHQQQHQQQQQRHHDSLLVERALANFFLSFKAASLTPQATVLSPRIGSSGGCYSQEKSTNGLMGNASTTPQQLSDLASAILLLQQQQQQQQLHQKR